MSDKRRQEGDAKWETLDKPLLALKIDEGRGHEPSNVGSF